MLLVVQETGCRGLNTLTARLGSYKPGNASRDFYRNVNLPLERGIGMKKNMCTYNAVVHAPGNL